MQWRPASENLQGKKPREKGFGGAARYGDLTAADDWAAGRLSDTSAWKTANSHTGKRRCGLNAEDCGTN